MIYFNCDYNEGAHEKILERLVQTNREQTEGYGCDEYCRQAEKLILEQCQAEDAAVHFLVGGTQANATVIAAALRTHQGVLAAQTAHIHVHETGAVEAGGHKVLALPSGNGKLTAAQVEEAYRAHIMDDSHEHIVQPKMVYISQPTELGTLYSLAELEALSAVCRKNELFLFADGARLGYGLTASDNDVTLQDLARLCDVFYIGGTKVGALFGEAVVITNPLLQKDFRYVIKQQGGMLAKGRLLGIQFMTLFENNLYREIAGYANGLAERIRETLYQKKIPFLVESHTNQLFPILPDVVLEKLAQKYCYTYQQRIDEAHSAVRFCTSWATQKAAVDELCGDLMELL
ncbi:MAG: low specificity L-threonine aldolase [Blautia sp.]|nr:low specificity L-threonine aldolase [Blautia sp.]MCM1200130.1 low specificity L-threonine aldolase [Bacteroides fragilis]